MPRDALYLADILAAIEAIQSFVAKMTKEQFFNDDKTRSAVQQKLTIIGEAVTRLPKELREKHAHIEWRAIAAFRNIIVHQYFSINWNIVWETVCNEIPTLKQQISTLIAAEYPNLTGADDAPKQ